MRAELPGQELADRTHRCTSTECYRKLGDLARARDHLQHGQAAVGALGDDGYGQMIKGGRDRLAEQLAPPDNSVVGR